MMQMCVTQVGNLKALKNATNIPLIQLMDATTVVIPGEASNRVGLHSLCPNMEEILTQH